jgi:hypothetical protein
MGMQIIDDDGTLVHEFPPNLGKHLLYRLLIVAKFTGEDQAEIILNDKVAALGASLARSMPKPTVSVGRQVDELPAQVLPRILGVFREQVLGGQLPWAKWSAEEKRDFVTNTLFAPYAPSQEFVDDFVSDEDSRLERVRLALSQ